MGCSNRPAWHSEWSPARGFGCEGIPVLAAGLPTVLVHTLDSSWSLGNSSTVCSTWLSCIHPCHHQGHACCV